MTIYLYSGTPGSGKSLHAARDVRDALKYKKIPVIANYEFNVSELGGEFQYVPNADLTPDVLKRRACGWWESHSFKEDSILLVIDECQLLFNSRDWNRSDRMGWLEFFSQHRKYGYKVIFIAQFDRMIDRQIRALLEYDVQHRKVSNYGKLGWFVHLMALGELFYCCTYYYPLGQKVGGEWLRYSRKLGALYDSYKTFEGHGGAVGGEGALGGSLPPIAPPLQLEGSLRVA